MVIPEGYSLEITAVCPSRIREIHAAFAAPAAGSVLADEAMLTFDNGRSGKYPISWTYEEETQEESLSYESAAEEADISPVPETEKPELSEANPAESSGEEKEAEDSVSEKPEADEPEGSEAFAALEDNDEPLPEEGEADTLHEDTDTLREEADTLHKTVSSKPSEENEPDGEEKKDSEKDASEPEEDERQSESLIEESESASSKTVPSSGIAWGDTAYTAVIFVPQDMANQILFADQLSGSSESGEVTKVIRNNADGSAEIEIEFEKTAESGEYVRPDAEISLLAKAFDLNLQDYDESFTRQYYVPGNRIVTLSAPEVEDELFLQWNLLDSGIILADEDNDGQPDCSLSDRVIKVRIPEMPAGNELEIRAEFIPGIREVSAEISIPVTGQPLQSEANADTLKVTISNQYEIDPEFVSISWTPQPESEESEEKIADYLMYYTVVIRIVPKTDSEGPGGVRSSGSLRFKRDVSRNEAVLICL